MTRRPAVNARVGYTLAEVFVVIGVIGLLVGLLMPAVQRSRAAAKRVDCGNALRQVGLALQNHHAAYGRYPPAGVGSDSPQVLLSWQAQLLPYLEHEALWAAAVAACAADPVPYHAPPHVGYVTPVREFICPADARLGVALRSPAGDLAAYDSYIGVLGGYSVSGYGKGVFSQISGIRSTDVSDGTSQTVAVGERPPPDSLKAGQWYNAAIVGGRFGWPNQHMDVPQVAMIGAGTD